MRMIGGYDGNAVALIPLDKWFGTFHDGTPEKQEAMEKRLAVRAAKGNRR